MNRDFFLGALVAIALLLLWNKERKAMGRSGLPPYISPNLPGYAGGCAGGCGSDAAAPDAQARIDIAMGSYAIGKVSPSAPPLGGAGTVPADTSYMNQIKYWNPVVNAPSSYAPNTSGPTPRAVATAPTYSDQAFVNRSAIRNLGTGRYLN